MDGLRFSQKISSNTNFFVNLRVVTPCELSTEGQCLFIEIYGSTPRGLFAVDRSLAHLFVQSLLQFVSKVSMHFGKISHLKVNKIYNCDYYGMQPPQLTVLLERGLRKGQRERAGSRKGNGGETGPLRARQTNSQATWLSGLFVT